MLYSLGVAKRLRILGLVRLADGVRRELALPLSAQQRDRLAARVAQSLARVEQIVGEAGSRIDRLPAPSRRAIQFLRSIEWDKVPVAADGAPAGHDRRVSWPGLPAFVERATDRLAEASGPEQVEAVRRSIETMSRQIEGAIERRKLSPRELAPASRALRGWLAFFSRGENLTAYVAAERRAAAALSSARGGRRRFPPPLRVQFRPMHGIYKIRTSPRGTLLRLPTAAIAFDAADFDLVASLIFHTDRGTRQQVVERMTAEGFQAIQAELESLSGILEQTRGAFHDLGESFDRVNRRYFAGSMARPRIAWSPSFTGRKFGHYDWIADTVMVSRTLDASAVPELVVDFIMYHELLHKKHGLSWVNGRGYAHTAEFYREEKQFDRYPEAEALLEQIARGAPPR